MDKSLLKMLPERQKSSRETAYGTLNAAFTISHALGVPITVSFLLFSSHVATNWLNKPELGFPLQIMALSVIPLTLLNLALSATKALRIMAYDAVVTGVCQPLLLILLALPILWVNNATVALALAHSISAVVALMIAASLFRRHYSISRSMHGRETGAVRRLFAFSTPLGIHDFVLYLAGKSEMFVLAFFVTSADLGAYALAIELASAIKKLRQTLDPILIPVISEFQSRDLTDRVRDNMVRVIRWMLIIGVPFVMAMVLFANPVLSVFGEGFGRAAPVAALLCLAHLVNANGALLDKALLAAGRPALNLLNASLLLAVQVSLSILLVPFYGLRGAAVAATVAAVFLGSVRLFQTMTVLRLNPIDRTQLKPIGAGVAAALSTELLRRSFEFGATSFTWVGFAVSFVVFYCLILYLLGIEPDDRYAIARLLRMKR
jgi:O-antigen/teichoic acid export membrane protein